MIDDLTSWIYPSRRGQMNIIYVVVLSIVLLLASYFIGGTYTVVPVASNSAVGSFVMNRYTGRVWLCNVNVCREVPTQVPGPAPGN
jgi:hypothetical protein